MQRLLPVFCMIVLVVGGCDWLDDLRDPPTEGLTGQTWQLVDVRLAQSDSLLFAPGVQDDTLNYRYDVRFQDGDTLRAHSACNQCAGGYERGEDHALSIAALTCTEMACRSGFNLYDDYLYRVQSYRLRAGSLLLYGTTRNGERFVMRHRGG